MRIKKIMKVQNFGQYNDFNWPSGLDEFKKYNFFYGWNYSGKTTLSRILRCFEKKQPHDDYPNATFSLELEDSQKLTEKNISNDYPIRVFNEDFIEDNFDWNNENAEIDPILILGKESKELEKKLKDKLDEKKKREEEKNKIENDKRQKERTLQDKLTNKASEIRNILSITNPRDFDKNALENKISSIKDNYANNILNEVDESNLLNLYRSQKLEKISFNTIGLKINELIEATKNILNKKVTPQKIIVKFSQNARLSQWVKEGIELHKNENTCQFCGNTFTSERLEELNKHFSKEFDSLIDEIKQKEKDSDEHLKSIERYTLPDKAKFYQDLQNEYEKLVKDFENTKNEYIVHLKSLQIHLSRKKEKPFESVSLEETKNNNLENVIKHIIDKIRKKIEEHNERVDSFDSEKNKANEKLILHYCAKFIDEHKYFDEKNEIDQLSKKIREIETLINDISGEINNIEQQIKASTIGSQILNDYLNNFFGDDILRIEPNQNGNYKLYRNNQIAKNLSTGERNIISLIYFFAKLEETNFDIGNAIIFIDDPVSSLDANHMHRVYAFLSEKTKKIGQLFITTHNYEFFNLLKDLYRYDLNNQNGQFYLIKKINNSNHCCSTIENLPSLLRKYKSEYNYLFYLLKAFNEQGNKQNFEQLFLLPNILRRFFEMYLFMKYPDGKKFKEKANKFFEGSSEIDKKTLALKIMDEYSHEENPEHSMRFPDMQELTTAVEFVLESLEGKDKEHYDALCQSLKLSEA